MMRFNTIAKKIEALFKNCRDSYINDGLHDPIADVRVEANKDHILIVYSEGGYHELTYQTIPETTLRNQLRALAEEHGFFIEDINNWSMGIYRA